MSSLHITLVQTDLFWENASANRRMLENKLDLLHEPTQLIVLPEAFTTGFTMNAEAIAEEMEGESISWMKHMAKKKKAIIAGSLFIKEDGCYFNRMIWMLPNGSLGYYDKRHLFSLAGEDDYYTSGEQRVIAQVNGFKVNLQICYDLRFPVWSRQQSNAEYDILLYVANWPTVRIDAWKTLLKARAIENQCYVIGVNRTGVDGTGKAYCGASSLISASGEILYQKEDAEDLFQFVIDKESILKTREQFPFLNDRDEFKLI